MRSTFILIVTLALCNLTFGRPNDLKYENFDDDKELYAKKKVYRKEVAAGGGGLYASAGVGDGVGASAGIGGFSVGTAGAGAGAGASAGAGAGVGGEAYDGKPGSNHGTFFDRIFAIPINVLYSVNDYLKVRGPKVHVHHSESDDGVAGAGVSAEAGSFAGASAGGVGAGAGIVSGGAKVGGVRSDGGVAYAKEHHRVHVKDGEALQIPIAALKSVNDFLNGK